MAAAGLVALETGRERLARGPRARPAARRGRGRAAARARSIWIRSKRTWSSCDTEAVGLPALETIERLAALGVGAVPVTGGGPDGDPRRRGRRRHRVRDRRLASRRRRRGEGGVDGPVPKNYPPEIADAGPAGPAAGEDLAGPALRADPDVRRRELGPRGLRTRREPVHAVLRGAAGAARASTGARRHALRDRLDARSTTLGGRPVPDADGARAGRPPRRSG